MNSGGGFHTFGGESRLCLINWLSVFFMFSCIVCKIPLISQWGFWCLSQQLLGVHYRYIRIHFHTHTRFRGSSQPNVHVLGLWAKEGLESPDLEPAPGYMAQFSSLFHSRPLRIKLTQAFFFIEWPIDHFTAFAVAQTHTTAVFHGIRVNAVVTANILETKTNPTRTRIYKTRPGKHHRNTRGVFCVLINAIPLKDDILLCNTSPLPLFSFSYPATLPCTLH